MIASARNLAFLVSLFAAVAVGCTDRSESEAPKQPPELKKKISAATETTLQTTKQEDKKVAIPAAAKETKPSEGEQAPQKRLIKPSSPEKKGLIQPKKSEGVILAEGLGKTDGMFYNPKGKHDPFESPFKTQTTPVVTAKQKKAKKRLPLTPLQRISLGQLKLVAIVMAPGGNKALVEEPSGKGYIISKGTYVGQNFGRVKSILGDRIIVEEEAEDFLSGSLKLRTTELKLYNKVGDV